MKGKEKHASMIIESLLDTDLYKFSMCQVVHHRFPNAQVRYQFKNRTKDIDLRPYAGEIADELAHYATLRFQPDELAFLRSIRWFKRDFVDSLVGYQADFSDVKIDTTGDDLAIE